LKSAGEANRRPGRNEVSKKPQEPLPEAP